MHNPTRYCSRCKIPHPLDAFRLLPNGQYKRWCIESSKPPGRPPASPARALDSGMGRVPGPAGLPCDSCRHVPPRSPCYPLRLENGRTVHLCSRCRWLIRPGVQGWRIIALGELLARNRPPADPDPLA